MEKNRENDITIILDNGGGITLQLIKEDDYGRYQHNYESAEQAASDIRAYLAGGSDSSNPADWDGNEAEEHGWLDPAQDDIRNGGYRVLSVEDIRELDEDCGWGNGRDLHDALAALETA